MSNAFEEKQPWDRLPQENDTWFRRFEIWLKQKTPRSFLEVVNQERDKKGHKRTKNIPESWRDKPTLYHWEERKNAWDQAEQECLDREWKAQREQEKRDELAYSELLRQKSIAMLALPEIVEVVKRNRHGEETEFLLVPEFRAFKAASDMLGQAMHHARLALDMPTSHREINLKNLSTEDLYVLADRFRQHGHITIEEGRNGALWHLPVPEEEA